MSKKKKKCQKYYCQEMVIYQVPGECVLHKMATFVQRGI
jgi:hypothetical protein